MLRIVVLSALALLYAYSLAGLCGVSGVPLVRWSGWLYSARLIPGSSREFEDHLVSVLLFGGLFLVYFLRTMKRA